MKKIIAKLGNMRKSVEWVVYPKQGERIVIQSDKRIAEFDPATGEGVLSASHPSGAYFVHLAIGAKPITVPSELVQEILAAQPKSGDQIGPGVYVR